MAKSDFDRETRSAVLNASVQIRSNEKAAYGSFSGFGGNKKRFKGRAAEFGLADDYELAQVLVETALNNRAGAESREAVIKRYLIRMNGPIRYSCGLGQELIYPEIDDEVIATIVGEASHDTRAWDACIRIARDWTLQSRPIPEPMADWLTQALTREIKRPRSPGGRDSTDRDSVREAIKLAVNLALESGALSRTHDETKDKRLDPINGEGKRARSAFELVAMTVARTRPELFVTSYSGVRDIWRDKK